MQNNNNRRRYIHEDVPQRDTATDVNDEKIV